MGTESNDGESAVARAQSSAVHQLLKVGINGFGPFKSASEAAEEAMAHGRSREDAVRALIRTHVALAGAQGFVTNLGGFVTLPVTLPANVSAGYLIQTHLAGSIACVYGHDLDSDEVRTGVLLCLLGNAGVEVIKQFGIKVGSQLSMALIRRVPITLIRKINQRAGFMLVAKYGTTRATVTLAKGIPLLGGVIGGGFDVVATRAVGQVATKFFAAEEASPELGVASGSV